ncbi:5-formyltetrahydrofolate cyclo-ligase [Brevibacterium zhoupengii]|uniref:5-formyltetrahydrofolate cyclo-ligase n=1 Tax=Brevibacterium zhoupengii TaxID=2898795 RepID=UPI001E3B1124|nr:5-formyltetrahydrofolate cyclo-ligase [Brevibacterium zhoupengii]
MRVDAETSKAQLRKRIRSDRAARAAAEAESSGAGSESSGAELASPVAESAWQVVKGLRPDLDLTGCSMLAYAALAGEPDLDPAIDRFLAHGGTVYLPVVTSVGHALMFGTVTDSMSTLEPRGKWGIREPSPSLTASALLAAEVAPDLIFVPALGFGPGGARLGNGGGFYDRTFGPQGEVPLVGAEGEEPLAVGTRTDGGRTVPVAVYGVCFSVELDLPGLTIEPWDLQVPQAVTDQGVHTLA